MTELNRENPSHNILDDLVARNQNWDKVESHLNKTASQDVPPHGIPKHKLDATTDPTVSNDETENYSVGSRWINVTGDKEFVCADASEGAAVWKETTNVDSGAKLIAIIEDQKAQNTDGGSFDSGADRTRVLNTLVYDADGTVAIASNQFTITPNGEESFLIKWVAPAYQVDKHQTLLYNISDSVEVARGSTGKSYQGGSAHHDHSIGSTVVTISAEKVYEIRHRCETTKATDGFGMAANFGTEVYTRVEIYRLA